MSRCIGNVDDAELLQQMTTVVLQRVPSGGELFAQGMLELLWRDAVAGAPWLGREIARRHDDGRLTHGPIVPSTRSASLTAPTRLSSRRSERRWTPCATTVTVSIPSRARSAMSLRIPGAAN